MKAHKLFLYAVAGLVVGLIIENKALIMQQNIALKAKRLKRKTHQLLEKHS